MKIEQYQIPRASLLWIMGAQIICVFPHFSQVPAWIALVGVFCMVFRLLIHAGRLEFPSRRMRGLLAIICFIFVVVQYQSIYSLEPAVALLILTYFLKLIELHRLKDAYVILALSYFLIATEFVYSSKMNVLIYMFCGICTVTAALLAINQANARKGIVRTLATSTKLCLLSIPCALVLFVLFPRLQPLWTFSLNTSDGVIGLSDTLTPGDISNLGRSKQLAFRADFYSNIPPHDQLYWRAFVYSQFDGRTWSKPPVASENNAYKNAQKYSQAFLSTIKPQGPSTSYRVTLEPTNERHMIALEMPITFDNTLAMTSYYGLIQDEPVNRLTSYQVVSSLSHKFQTELDSRTRAQSLQLPMGYNPSTRSFAMRLYNTLNKNPDAFIQFILNKFNTEDYIYTLKPPIMGRESIDEFMFVHQKGFCAHYAGAFVFMMRAVGIPARIVGGYHGGEINPIGNHVLVHQFDAHAWTEVWLQGKGWVRIDPTGYVAPERIESGLREALTTEEFLEDQLFATVRYRDNRFLNQIRFTLDFVNHRWNQLVINYDSRSQRKLLSDVFGHMYQLKSILTMLVLIFLVLLATGLFVSVSKRVQRYDRTDVLYISWLDWMHKLYPERSAGETPRGYLHRLQKSDVDSIILELAEDITRLYESLRYEKLDSEMQRQKISELSEAVRQTKQQISRHLLTRTSLNISTRT